MPNAPATAPDHVPAWRCSAAPMMGVSDVHWRWLLRRVSRHALLYTEMITAPAIIYGARQTLADNAPADDPNVALQLGGSDPAELAAAVGIANRHGFVEYDLNCGCPSDRAVGGTFGACLMMQPELVARCVEAMRGATDLPVTVKHRIGVDDFATYERMLAFVDAVVAAGAARVTVHARAAWLDGLDPEANRTIPPLRHAEVWQLKQDRPEVDVVINGGILTIPDALRHLEHVDGVMLGRAVRDDPFTLATVDGEIFGVSTPIPDRVEVAEAYAGYLADLSGGPLWDIHAGRHLMPLFRGLAGARDWKRGIAALLATKTLTAQTFVTTLAEMARRIDEAGQERAA